MSKDDIIPPCENCLGTKKSCGCNVECCPECCDCCAAAERFKIKKMEEKRD